ncbi:hypothetical protein [Nocardia testacea]|uniref:hypothetical protein n=1 Tax=Nocardia testacea TaxID=248551 RepID=UPI0033F01C15
MNRLAVYLRRRQLRRKAAIAGSDPATWRRLMLTTTREPGSLQRVTVRDRISGPAWAFGALGPIRAVTIGASCPRCGEPRGVPAWSGPVQTWTNPCGHLDTHTAVVDEACELILGARVDIAGAAPYIAGLPR